MPSMLPRSFIGNSVSVETRLTAVHTWGPSGMSTELSAQVRSGPVVIIGEGGEGSLGLYML